METDLLLNDGEGAPEIYNVATMLDQAKLGFNACYKMVRQSPTLRKHIRKRAADLYAPSNLGFIKALEMCIRDRHEAKLTLPHGAWGAWLQNEVEFSERTAQNFMRIAKEYRNPQLIADMGNSATKALLLLSLPAEEREEFVGEAHEIDGEEKTVAAMTTKEMERLLKELEAERAEKELSLIHISGVWKAAVAVYR